MQKVVQAYEQFDRESGATGMLDVEVQPAGRRRRYPAAAADRVGAGPPGGPAAMMPGWCGSPTKAESRQLNHDYRGIDKPTNVLSFPFEPIPQIELQHIGDLVLCARWWREAREQNGKAVHPNALGAHGVHGMLHLQGYDHETDRAGRCDGDAGDRYPDRAGLSLPM